MKQEAETQQIALSRLEKSPLNARRTVKQDGLDELKASILAHGLMQNLVVTANGGGTFYVIAGARRLAAMRSLQDEGKLPEDHAVPCQVVSEEHALEMSLAENTIREAMHPADEFETYAALAESGKTTAEIAERFGTTEKHVRQRLQLGRVAPELLEAYRREEFTLETLEVFTLTDDRARQLKVYEALSEWEKDNGYAVKRLLTEAAVSSKDKLARFVGLDAYQAAGGTVRADLFSEDQYLDDPDLLHRLAGEKLSGIKQRLEADGWGWVEVVLERDWSFASSCSRIRGTPVEPPAELVQRQEALEAERTRLHEQDPEGEDDSLTARLDEIEDELSDIRDKIDLCVSFDPKKMAKAGCYVAVEHDGKLSVELGLVRKKDQKEAEKATKEKSGSKSEDDAGISQALKQDLEAYRLQAARVEIAEHPDVAFDLFVFHAACDVLDSGFSYSGPGLQFSQVARDPSVEAATKSAKRFEQIEKELSLKWMKPDDEAERFALFRKLSREEKDSILAYCIATALRPGLADKRTATNAALASIGGELSESWRPTKANYLGRITREQLIDIGQEVLGNVWRLEHGGKKKAALVDALDAAFADPESHGETPEQVEKLLTWLPPGMAFIEQPKPTKGKKAKKSA